MRSRQREEFSGLHDVEGSAFAQVIGDHPEMQTMGHRQVSPEPPHEDRILATRADRLGVMQTRPIIFKHDAGRLCQQAPGRIDTQRLHSFQRDRGGMAMRQWHIGGGRGYRQLWDLQQLARLQDQGHFLLRIGIVKEIPALWHAVEGHLVRKDLGLRWTEIEQVT